MQDNLVILGGNDNDVKVHPLNLGDGAFTMPIPDHSGNVCRYDEKYEFWTIFNTNSGTKVRFQMRPQSSDFKVAPERASAPELVDLKITNYCNRNCPYCYQGSNKDGIHANSSDIWNIRRQLSEMEVFEVAIGGGEPTCHPKFVEILHDFRSSGIIPNFTTGSSEWLNDPILAKDIIEACGAFGFSACNASDVRKISAALEHYGFSKSKCNIHLVLGVLDKWNISSMLSTVRETGINATILDYKTTGRGSDFKPKDYSEWITWLKAELDSPRYGGIGIDTPLAAKYDGELKSMGVPDWMYDIKEGAFSCYVDAVGMKAGPSSYCSENEMVDIGGRSSSILDEFQLFGDKGRGDEQET
jgi:hypothetical protein